MFMFLPPPAPAPAMAAATATARTITVPAHAYVVGATGLVKRGAAGFGGAIAIWIKKLISACFVAAMIATGVLLFTHFTNKWTQSGYPAIPISALNLGGATDTKQKPAIPLQGSGQYRHQVHTSAQPSNFRQYMG